MGISGRAEHAFCISTPNGFQEATQDIMDAKQVFLVLGTLRVYQILRFTEGIQWRKEQFLHIASFGVIPLGQFYLCDSDMKYRICMKTLHKQGLRSTSSHAINMAAQ